MPASRSASVYSRMRKRPSLILVILRADIWPEGSVADGSRCFAPLSMTYACCEIRLGVFADAQAPFSYTCDPEGRYLARRIGSRRQPMLRSAQHDVCLL